MGGGSPSPSPSPVGSPRGHTIEGYLTNALNCRIQPENPGSSAAAAMTTCIAGFPPHCGSPCQHQKHKLKCHLKIKHRHHGPPKIKHKHHGHIKIKHRHHHCHPMNVEEHLGCGFHHQRPHHHGGPPPPPPSHPHAPSHGRPFHHHGRHNHQMRQRHHGHCCSHGYHHFFAGPMAVPVPPPPALPHRVEDVALTTAEYIRLYDMIRVC